LRAQSKAASFSNFIFIFSNSKSHPDRETYNSRGSWKTTIKNLRIKRVFPK
jgi:hypothetical protein